MPTTDRAAATGTGRFQSDDRQKVTSRPREAKHCPRIVTFTCLYDAGDGCRLGPSPSAEHIKCGTRIAGQSCMGTSAAAVRPRYRGDGGRDRPTFWRLVEFRWAATALSAGLTASIRLGSSIRKRWRTATRREAGPQLHRSSAAFAVSESRDWRESRCPSRSGASGGRFS